MDNRPIGFLDSGVGGLTVARELMRQLPHEEIVLYRGLGTGTLWTPSSGTNQRIYLAVGQFIDKECENDCFCM